MDEEWLVHELDTVLDYEAACKNLTPQNEAIVKRLIEIVGPVQATKKHKYSMIFKIDDQILSSLQVPTHM